VNGRIIFGNSEMKVRSRQSANRGHDRIGGNNAIALRGDQVNPGIQQNLLIEQNIEGRALAHLRLLPDAIERDLPRNGGHL